MADVGVRAARREDVLQVANTQIRAWRYGYRDFLPEGPLEQMTGAAAEKMWLRQWDEAIVAPPTPRHRVLVAVETILDTEGFTASDIAISAEVFRRSKQEIAELTAYHTGQTVERILADSDRDKWFAADEARDYGFVDHIANRANLPSS